MEKHGIRIESCPRCGKQGLLIERPTVTKRGDKKYTYRKLYVAHYLGNGISRNGKPVDRIQWCYLNAEHIKELQSQGVTQNFTQNVTQTSGGFCVTQDKRNPNIIPQNNCELWWVGLDLNRRPSARQVHACMRNTKEAR